ncbi:MAG: glucose 1-dehydrogenase [Planctomycetales bacterium]|nr:glucose 1-dehydrogenase [Planctomycetales bacterium]
MNSDEDEMADELFSVSGQTVLISGGSRGIGEAIAVGFARRGATTIITGRHTETLAETARRHEADGVTLEICECDVSQRESIDRCVRDTLERFGKIDTLVNVAGVNRRKPCLEVTDEDFDFVLDINLRGAFLMSREVGRHMVERQSGCQINIASLNTDRPLHSVGPYAMSKAAMGHMTRVLALEWGEFGVRVNGLAPGFILTDLTKQLWSDEKMQQWGLANTPQRRLGTPEDMVGTALFLASPAAAFMTGQTLFVDGGYSAGWAWPIPPGGGQ